MSFLVRDGKFDVAVVAGPRVNHWPSIGVKALSSFCAEMGLKVGLIGGNSHRVRGVFPLPGTGGLVLAEDPQNRIHRIQARVVVMTKLPVFLPDPFPGWRLEGLIPIATAVRLKDESQVTWEPSTVILGTGNRALRFGSDLLEGEASREVYCVETFGRWGKKRYRGWEVERRRFETLSGKLVEATPVSLKRKAPLLWELRLKDDVGIRVIDVARVVTAGPFRDTPLVREYPPGSSLFEMEQTARLTREEDIEGWMFEEESGRALAAKIVKRLGIRRSPVVTGKRKSKKAGGKTDQKETLDQVFRSSRKVLESYEEHRDKPFELKFQGKLLSRKTSQSLRSFAGVPRSSQEKRVVATLECVEGISCRLCEKACPESAIQINRGKRAKESFLLEDRCTACGACLPACPSGVTAMILERDGGALSQLTLFWKGKHQWKKGELALLLSRKGGALGSARVSKVYSSNRDGDLRSMFVQLEVPSHLIWEARGIRKPVTDPNEEPSFLLDDEKKLEDKVEISINGKRRLVREDIPLSIAFFENGISRPEDVLLCPDGSCQLCQVSVDGAKRLACQTRVRRGMSVVLKANSNESSDLCPCLGITSDQVVERIQNGNFNSVEAVLAVTHVGEGKCSGQLCRGSFRRLMMEQGFDVEQWIDWRFPFSEWILVPGPSGQTSSQTSTS